MSGAPLLYGVGAGQRRGRARLRAVKEDSLPLDTVVVLHGLRSKSEYNGEWGAITSAAPTAEGRWEAHVRARAAT